MTRSSLTSFCEGDRRKVIHQTSRMDHWKAIFMGSMSGMFTLNFLAILALAPILYLAFAFLSAYLGATQILPYASGLGASVITIVDTAAITYATQQDMLLELMLYLPVAIVVSSILLAPFFYGMRNAEYDGIAGKLKDALRGFKFLTARYAILGVICAVWVELCLLGLYLYNNMVFAGGVVGPAFLLAGIVIFSIAFIIMMGFCYTLCATYKMSVWGAVKWAVEFTLKLSIQNLFILVVACLPLFFFFLGTSMISMILMLYIFFGFSYMLSVWMVYVQTVYTAQTPQNAKKTKKA